MSIRRRWEYDHWVELPYAPSDALAGWIRDNGEFLGEEIASLLTLLAEELNGFGAWTGGHGEPSTPTIFDAAGHLRDVAGFIRDPKPEVPA